MGDAESALPPSKKRAAGRELSRDNPGLDDEEDSSELESGTFKKATDEVLATRRIVKVRRNQTASTPSSNPFAGIRLVPSTEPSATVTPATTEPTKTVSPAATELLESSENKVSVDANNDAGKEAEKGDGEDNKQSESKIDEPVAVEAASSEPEKGEDDSSKQTESKNEPASADAAGKKSSDDKENGAEKSEVDNGKTAGVDKPENEEEKETSHETTDSSQLSSFGQLSSTQNAFTGLAGTGFSTSTFAFGSIPKDGSASNSTSASVFGQEVVVETGEENEKVVFSADSVLFEFLDGSWKERGKGELKVNVSTNATGRARLLMRARGNYRLILNASLYSDMKLTNMDKKGITFACINSATEGKSGLSTFALKFRDASIVEEFRTAVAAHKDKTTAVLKTPENSPKATDD
ncbi:nuclear pore complex protein NUP50A [Citrus sinensis]|nr:nuclear pore complex protein NUP50A [Citrus sinensis]